MSMIRSPKNFKKSKNKERIKRKLKNNKKIGVLFEVFRFFLL